MNMTDRDILTDEVHPSQEARKVSKPILVERDTDPVQTTIETYAVKPAKNTKPSEQFHDRLFLPAISITAFAVLAVTAYMVASASPVKSASRDDNAVIWFLIIISIIAITSSLITIRMSSSRTKD